MSLWYYQDAHGHQVGPVTDGAFHDLRELGTVRDTTLIWRTGWSDWTTFADIWFRGGPPTLVPAEAKHETVAKRETGSAAEPAPEPGAETKAESTTTMEDEEKQTPPPLRLENPIKEEQFEEIKYATCSVCHQQWPEHLLFGNGRMHVCANCLKAHEQKRRDRQRLKAQRSGVNSGVTSWIYKLLVVGLIMAGLVIYFFHFLQNAAK